MKTQSKPPTLDQLGIIPLSEVQDFENGKSRTGSIASIKYKIADCDDKYASRAIVIDWNDGSRGIIRSCDSQWDQFIHRGC
jgi:hypothetical protein